MRGNGNTGAHNTCLMPDQDTYCQTGPPEAINWHSFYSKQYSGFLKMCFCKSNLLYNQLKERFKEGSDESWSFSSILCQQFSKPLEELFPTNMQRCLKLFDYRQSPKTWHNDTAFGSSLLFCASPFLNSGKFKTTHYTIGFLSMMQLWRLPLSLQLSIYS